MPSRPRMRRPLLLAALGGGALAPGFASAEPGELFFSPGLILSFTPDTTGTHRVALGFELSVNLILDDAPVGVGGLVQAEFLFGGRARVAIGGQAFTYGLGVELATAVHSADGVYDVRGVIAPFVGIGVLNYASRFEIGDDVIHGKALTFKLPVDRDGEFSTGLFGPTGQAVEGRPLRAADGSTVRPATVDLGPARASTLTHAAAELPTPMRRALAAAWLETARDEHASIAAFARLARHLAAHRAPATLVAAAHRAAADEVRHARGAFAIASALTGRRLVPLTRPVAIDPAPSLARMAVESHRDGERNEGRAAAGAALAASAARLPAIRHLLLTIAVEEAAHARLGAAVAEWAAATEPAARRALAAARSAPAPRLEDGEAPLDAPAWRAWGRLDATDRRIAHAAA